MTEYKLNNGMVLYRFVWNFIDSNMYLIECGESIFVIDPVATNEVSAFIDKKHFTKAAVVLTHEHFDHINGLNYLREHIDCTVYANKVCAENIKSSAKNMSEYYQAITMFNERIRDKKMEIEPFTCTADIFFDSDYCFIWNNICVKLITTQGHTQGSICILLNGSYIFTGDTLLAIPTITRMPGGSRKLFELQTIPMIRKLSDEKMTAFPGHGEKELLSVLLDTYDNNYMKVRKQESLI